jgi:threonine dehydrogenase-like Zn-dependent dehydrogenase
VTVLIAGAGPAGAAAAISARQRGATVTLFDPSPFPRHKVCGEFLSPGIVPLLEQLGVWERIRALHPHPYTRLGLHFPQVSKRAPLPRTAWGLSRYALDAILRERALELGAAHRRERFPAVTPGEAAVIRATGRRAAAGRRPRLFGFKAHFQGEAEDSIDLYFFDRIYVGVNAVEGGFVNVCGLAPEDALQPLGFNPEGLFARHAGLQERLSRLRRTMSWMVTGPLVYSRRVDSCQAAVAVGDALAFIDPFTGSGILNAVLTGYLGGIAAVECWEKQHYCAVTQHYLGRCLRVAGWLRGLLEAGWARWLLPVAPASLLVAATRPALELSQLPEN